MTTKKSHIEPLIYQTEDSPLQQVAANEARSVEVRYDDELKLERRRPLAGRPGGTECGNSCTCS